MIQPNGVTDLHRGERYGPLPSSLSPLTSQRYFANRFRYVDVAFASVINIYLLLGILLFGISYDIACKYSIHFLARVVGALLPEELLHRASTWLRWFVPKFHLGGHQPSCADQFSLNYAKGVGRLHGEHVETVWSDLNPLKYSTREMAPGTRIEVLSDAMNEWNYKKLITIRGSFLSSLCSEL